MHHPKITYCYTEKNVLIQINKDSIKMAFDEIKQNFWLRRLEILFGLIKYYSY